MDDSSTPIIKKNIKGDRGILDLLFFVKKEKDKNKENKTFSLVYLFTIKKNSGIIDKLD